MRLLIKLPKDIRHGTWAAHGFFEASLMRPCSFPQVEVHKHRGLTISCRFLTISANFTLSLFKCAAIFSWPPQTSYPLAAMNHLGTQLHVFLVISPSILVIFHNFLLISIHFKRTLRHFLANFDHIV